MPHIARWVSDLLLLRPLVLFSLMITVFVMSACVSRGDVESMSAAEFSKMRSTIPISNNATQRAYVNCVVRDIVSTLPEPYKSMNWDVELFENNAANAFAMAGGKIGVFTGIFNVAKTQDQFASVIGHEIAHVTEDHTVDRINRAQVTGGAVSVSSILLGDQLGIGTQNAQVLIDGAAQLGMTLPFGRKQESEADLVGLDYMASAGFDPRASIQLWKNMASTTNGAPPEFLSTHPSSDTRIGDLVGEMPEALPLYNQALATGKTPRCLR
ncbi:MAG: M48 family metallopeptidase [Gammaproteobacteria bacterium]|nr:M48 family metallopeptidase [Gammaproteobacteria bacterium]